MFKIQLCAHKDPDKDSSLHHFDAWVGVMSYLPEGFSLGLNYDIVANFATLDHDCFNLLSRSPQDMSQQEVDDMFALCTLTHPLANPGESPYIFCYAVTELPESSPVKAVGDAISSEVLQSALWQINAYLQAGHIDQREFDRIKGNLERRCTNV